MADQQGPQEMPPVFVHFIEAIDALGNIAKANGQYAVLVNALLTTTAIVLAELNDPEKAAETLKALDARQQQFRNQRIAAAAANAAQTTTNGAH